MEGTVLDQFRLEGRVAAITGAGGELCSCMSEALGKLGVKVALLDIDRDKAEAAADAVREAGGRAVALAADVLDEGNLQECRRRIEEEWGPPDILINGAGGNHPSGTTDREFLEKEHLQDPELTTIFKLQTDGFRKVFDLNFLGTFLPTRVFAEKMAAAGSGVVLNISSMNALTPLTKIPAYAAAKAAVSNFTQWLAVHFAHTGVRVNAIAPGFLMTEQLRFLHIDQETGELTPRAQQVIGHTPMGRYGDPEELLGAVVWLLSEASRFVTGIVVPIDGGFSSYSI
ncbi:MAG: SDR family oxidoreductase [Spirochaetes bacterium]|jgi:NAD(P)-dependent dehydrogenase (short-subunit alcohol dehydrogenase family)|nr:SDR family oxidoreductase [Spirochaetota bacterium]